MDIAWPQVRVDLASICGKRYAEANHDLGVVTKYVVVGEQEEYLSLVPIFSVELRVPIRLTPPCPLNIIIMINEYIGNDIPRYAIDLACDFKKTRRSHLVDAPFPLAITSSSR